MGCLKAGRLLVGQGSGLGEGDLGEMRREVFEDAVALYSAARRAGLTVRSLVDCLIGACAMRNGLTVLHHDRDFDRLSRVAPIEVSVLQV